MNDEITKRIPLCGTNYQINCNVALISKNLLSGLKMPYRERKHGTQGENDENQNYQMLLVIQIKK